MTAGSVLPHANGQVPGWVDEAGRADATAGAGAGAGGRAGTMIPERLTIAALCEKFAPVCAAAVDPLEVASALEFEGYGDRIAREEYGLRDVFALAQVLYRRVPRHPGEPEPAPDPWQQSRWQPLLHGLLYALPAVCFPAAGALLAGPGVLPALVVALLVAWGLAQGLAAVGYSRLGSGGIAQARRVLRSGLFVGLVGVGAAMASVRLAVHAHQLVLLFGAGEGVYMLGACVLMVVGAERWLPAALAPGVLGSASFLLLGRPPRLEHLAWGALAATPLLCCAIALARTRTPDAAMRAGLGRLAAFGARPSAAELRAAVPALAFGVVAAALLTFPVINGPHGHGGVNAGALVASIPLSLSMGGAEWCLLWYRRRTRLLLRTVGDVRAFRRRARGALLSAIAQYVAGTVVLVAIGVAVAASTGLVHLERIVALEAAGYLVLGTAMFVAMLLQTMRVRALPLAAAVAALVTEIVLHRFGVTIELIVPVAFLLVVGGYAVGLLGGAVRHGY